MKKPISDLDRTAITGVIQQMENGWNAGDARSFAAPMAEDIDFITIRADHLRGRQAVIDSHLDVLSTFYAGSTHRFNVHTPRMLREDVPWRTSGRSWSHRAARWKAGTRPRSPWC